MTQFFFRLTWTNLSVLLVSFHSTCSDEVLFSLSKVKKKKNTRLCSFCFSFARTLIDQSRARSNNKKKCLKVWRCLQSEFGFFFRCSTFDFLRGLFWNRYAARTFFCCFFNFRTSFPVNEAGSLRKWLGVSRASWTLCSRWRVTPHGFKRLTVWIVFKRHETKFWQLVCFYSLQSTPKIDSTA